jgi:formimidoylglutamate deiminase
MQAVMDKLFFNHLLLPQGWAGNVAVTVGPDGNIAAIEPGASASGADCHDIALPGIVNAHSHAFQRAMAGLAEYRQAKNQSAARDTFWTWREVMYRFATAVTPEDQRVISAHLQVELLKQGFTSLVEFHYLHNQPGGTAYSNPAEMALATIEAAKLSGIGFTLIPTLYMTAGFDGAPLSGGQTRFYNNPGTLLNIAAAADKAAIGHSNIAVGLAAHSLRAVPAGPLADLIAAHGKRGPQSPFHMHIAEQVGEVEDCLRHSGQKPVEWLLGHADVDRRWTLVHSTHVSLEEVAQLSKSRAVAALCPTTEGNLGDGIFPLADYLKQGGRMAIGTDSHVSISPWEEMRWLEYMQRLTFKARNIAATEDVPHTGTRLFGELQGTAANVTGRNIGHLAVGARADLIVLDDRLPQFAGRSPDQALDTAIFASLSSPLRHVMVGGEWVVRDGRHADEDKLAEDYRNILLRLTQN